MDPCIMPKVYKAVAALEGPAMKQPGSKAADRALEWLLAAHCAPTLLGEKCASIVSLSNAQFPHLIEQLRRYNRRLAKQGLVFSILCECASRRLLLVYRPALLSRRLTDPETIALLQQFGYDTGENPARLLYRLRRRMGRHGKFPHEIGLFLGYPPKDVSDFMRTGGADCKLCGYWKVYHDVDAAKACFDRYDACCYQLVEQLQAGRTISELISGLPLQPKAA